MRAFCRLSLPCSSLRHLRPGVCARLHGAGLEAAELHRRRGYHRLLLGLPRGRRRRAGEVARGQHQGRQREGLQGGSVEAKRPDEGGGGGGGFRADASFISVSLLALQVSDLRENKKYQFQVRAANMAGVGIPSQPSDTFLCEEWTIAVPGRFPPTQQNDKCSYVYLKNDPTIHMKLFGQPVQWDVVV